MWRRPVDFEWGSIFFKSQSIFSKSSIYIRKGSFSDTNQKPSQEKRCRSVEGLKESGGRHLIEDEIWWRQSDLLFKKFYLNNSSIPKIVLSNWSDFDVQIRTN